MLTRLVYVSELDPGATDIDVHAMLATARVHNRRLDLTGLMVRSARHVAHVLEGRAAALGSLMDWAHEEPLHRDVRVVACGPVERRRFDNWSVSIVRRFDLANDIAELFRTGAIRELVSEAIVERLVLASLDDLVLRMQLNAPRAPERRGGDEPPVSRRRQRGPEIERRVR